MVQTSERCKKYKRFLHDVLCISGPGVVLVCAAALGYAKVADMKKSNRVVLVREIKINKENTDLNHPSLHALAAHY